MAPPCWVSNRHLTSVGPFVSMVPLISIVGAVPEQPGTLIVLGSVLTVTLVTVAVGLWTTPIPDRLPPVTTTLPATQQPRPGLSGSLTSHQVLSVDRPVICAVCPTTSALSGTQAVPGPRRQFTLTPLGDTIGIVDVGGGGAVFVGRGVEVGPTVGSARVADGVIRNSVGVSVTAGVATGKLQASMARMRTSAGNKTRSLIISPFLNSSSQGASYH